MWTVRDNIYGDLAFSDDFVAHVIDHPLFQRLRSISQNGFLSYVFPGSRHSRFEHSIGVAHLLSKAWTILDQQRLEVYGKRKNLQETLENGNLLDFSTTNDVVEAIFQEEENTPWRKIFILAGLLHDLGHGPFSHAFDELGLLNTLNFEEIIDWVVNDNYNSLPATITIPWLGDTERLTKSRLAPRYKHAGHLDS